MEVEVLKEGFEKLTKSMEKALAEFRLYKHWLHMQFQTGGTPVDLLAKIKNLENKHADLLCALKDFRKRR